MTIKSYFKYVDPTIITGPIFDKELRVSSRRKRNYVLRSLYLIALTIVVSLFWIETVLRDVGGNMLFQSSRMSQAGLMITTSIIWFQFIATMIVAVVMLSTSISDEIYNKTLGELMSTPISSFQIVMGKLLSKLLQLMLLIALSLPLLSVVRVLGGIPWGFVISSLCVNLTAIIFTGSLSMYFSVSGRKSYEVIIKTLFVLGMLFIFLPVIAAISSSGLLWNIRIPENIILGFLYYTNPLMTVYLNTAMLLSPGGVGVTIPTAWYISCLLMLVFSTLLLVRSVVIVRRVALMQALGQSVLDIRKERKNKKREKSGKPKLKAPTKQNEKIRSITCSPVIWKEMRVPMIQGGRVKGILGFLGAFAALLFTYWLSVREGTLNEDYVHTSYSVVFMIIGVIVSMVLSATTITSEKESRTWPLLMATSLDDWEILFGKIIGVFKRCVPIWLFLAGHVIFFTLRGYIHPVALLHLSLTVGGTMIFLAGSGLYFSSRFKRTATAVVANFSLVLFIWVILPMLSGLFSQLVGHYKIFENIAAVNPVIQTWVVMNGDGGYQNSGLDVSQLEYDWPWKYDSFAFTTTVVLLTSLAYALTGTLFAWRAKKRFRKKIF